MKAKLKSFFFPISHRCYSKVSSQSFQRRLPQNNKNLSEKKFTFKEFPHKRTSNNQGNRYRINVSSTQKNRTSFFGSSTSQTINRTSKNTFLSQEEFRHDEKRSENYEKKNATKINVQKTSFFKHPSEINKKKSGSRKLEIPNRRNEVIDKSSEINDENLNEEKDQFDFQDKHIIDILYRFHNKVNSRIPLDKFIIRHFQKHEISEINKKFILLKINEIIRWKLFINFLCTTEEYRNFRKMLDGDITIIHPRIDIDKNEMKKKENEDNVDLHEMISWQHRILVYKKLKEMGRDAFFNINEKFENQIPIWTRLSCPTVLFDMLKYSLGLSKTIEICKVYNTVAPLYARINPTKITRTKIIQSLQENDIYVDKCQESKYGIKFLDSLKVRVSSLKEYKDGLLDIQDESSQLVAGLIECKPGDKVLDYCGGTGGKTLAFGHLLKGKGVLYITDIRSVVLKEAKKRMKKCGIENYQPTLVKDLKLFGAQMDWILTDVPCSQTGVIRRNPDMKYNIDFEYLSKILQNQKIIFDNAIKLLKPNGTIVYSTCSILPNENEHQINYFIKKYNLKLIKELKKYPTINGMDGCYAAVMKKI